MDTFLEILKMYGIQLSAIGAAISFIFGVYKFQSERRAAHYWKEFEVYHELVKNLVGPEKEGDKLYLVPFLKIKYRFCHSRESGNPLKIRDLCKASIIKSYITFLETALDRQAAIIFELRNFKRYYPYTLRMLKGLKIVWDAQPGQYPRLNEELSLTIQFIEKNKKEQGQN